MTGFREELWSRKDEGGWGFHHEWGNFRDLRSYAVTYFARYEMDGKRSGEDTRATLAFNALAGLSGEYFILELPLNETIRCSDIDQIRQGDIMVLSDVTPSPTSPEFAVVINADCDLAHGKFDGVLALLPIFSFQSYLEAFWVKNHLVTELNQNILWLLNIFGIKEEESEYLELWLRSDSPALVASRS